MFEIKDINGAKLLTLKIELLGRSVDASEWFDEETMQLEETDSHLRTNGFYLNDELVECEIGKDDKRFQVIRDTMQSYLTVKKLLRDL